MTPPAQDATPMDDPLPERLRFQTRYTIGHPSHTMFEAADHIESLERANRALQAEVARLTEERDAANEQALLRTNRAAVLADKLEAEQEAHAALTLLHEGAESKLATALSAAESGRRDGERYRWLRMQHWNDAAMCVVAEPKVNVKIGTYCPSELQLDAAIDAAIAAQERAK